MEKENERKKGVLYIILAVLLLILVVIGGTYAYFSASKSNTSSITGRTLNISSSDLDLTISKVNFNGATVTTNLVPALIGEGISSPDSLTIEEIQTMLNAKCEEANKYTGCHVWRITATNNNSQDAITHANLWLTLSTNATNKDQWGYAVFEATEATTGVLTSAAYATVPSGSGLRANHGSLATAITGNTLDMHANASLNASTSKTYYLMVFLNDDSNIQNNTTATPTATNYDARGSYSGTVTFEAMGGQVRANFGTGVEEPQEEDDFVYTINIYDEEVEGNNLITLNQPFPAGINRLTEEEVQGQKSVYLKHKLDASDNVEESYVEFVINDTLKEEWKTSCTGTAEEITACQAKIDNLVNGTYSLRGGINESSFGTGNQPIYEANVEVLKRAFNFAEQPSVCTDGASEFTCDVHNYSVFTADAQSDGDVDTGVVGWDCLFDGGISACDEH